MSLLDSLLDLVNELLVFWISDLETRVHLLEPFVGLGLRVDIEGPTETLGNKDTILCGEVIGGKSVNLPLTSLSISREEVDEVVVPLVLHIALFDLWHPQRLQVITYALWNGPQ